MEEMSDNEEMTIFADSILDKAAQSFKEVLEHVINDNAGISNITRAYWAGVAPRMAKAGDAMVGCAIDSLLFVAVRFIRDHPTSNKVHLEKIIDVEARTVGMVVRVGSQWVGTLTITQCLLGDCELINTFKTGVSLEIDGVLSSTYLCRDTSHALHDTLDLDKPGFDDEITTEHDANQPSQN